MSEDEPRDPIIRVVDCPYLVLVIRDGQERRYPATDAESAERFAAAQQAALGSKARVTWTELTRMKAAS